MERAKIQAMLLDLDAERNRIDRAIRALSEMIGAEVPPSVGKPAEGTPSGGAAGKREAVPARAARRLAPGKYGGKGGATNSAPSPAPKHSGRNHPAMPAGRVIDRTLEALRKAGKPVHIGELARLIGHNPQTLQQCLAGYVKRGVLAHTGRAEFGLPQTAAAVVKRPAESDLDGGVEPRFSLLHLPEPYRGGFRCSRCKSYHPRPEDFDTYCSAEAGA